MGRRTHITTDHSLQSKFAKRRKARRARARRGPVLSDRELAAKIAAGERRRSRRRQERLSTLQTTMEVNRQHFNNSRGGDDDASVHSL